MLISRRALLAKPFMLWERHRARNVMKTAIILHSIVLEARRDCYDSGLYDIANEATKRGFLIDEHGNEKPFKLHTEDDAVHNNINNLDSGVWARQISKVDARRNDEVGHFVLKLDLSNHIWNNHGNVEF